MASASHPHNQVTQDLTAGSLDATSFGYDLDPSVLSPGNFHFLHQFAISRAQAQGLQTSRLIGSFATITGEGSEAPNRIPIMYRCVWPPNARSRHALVFTQPSNNLKALGRILDHVFGIVDSRGAVASTKIVWASGCTTTPETQLQFDWEYAMLGQLMNGIVEVSVESLEDALKCDCGVEIPSEDFVLRKLRMRYDRRMFKSVCFFCLDLRDIFTEEQQHEEEEEEEE